MRRSRIPAIVVVCLIILVIGATFLYNEVVNRHISVTYNGVIVNTKTWALEDHATISLKGTQKRNYLEQPQDAVFEGRIQIKASKLDQYAVPDKECRNSLFSFETGFSQDIVSGEVYKMNYSKSGSMDMEHIGLLRSTDFSYTKIELAYEKEEPKDTFTETAHVLIAPADNIKEAKQIYEQYFQRNKSALK